MDSDTQEKYLATLRRKTEIHIEMVCLGNICRSPMASAILHHYSRGIESPKFKVTSSGTSNFHIGDGPHPLSKKTWRSHGITYEHRARQFSSASFETQDLILAMDLTNRAMILTAAKDEDARNKVFMLRQFDPKLATIDPKSVAGTELQVPDPWGDELPAYESVFGMIDAAVKGLLDKLR